MQRLTFGIFAHPDDEAFGPSGTLLKMSRDGVDVHLVCVTGGESGVNNAEHADLRTVRLQEWRESGRLIGATSQYHLGFKDGELSNNKFHAVAGAIREHITTTVATYEDQSLDVTFMTFDTNGISGHIDHIVASMATSYVYYTLKNKTPEPIASLRLHYFCVSQTDFPIPNTGYVFMPAGHDEKTITAIVDISDIAEEKRAIMMAHESQRSDALVLLKKPSTLQREHFYSAN